MALDMDISRAGVEPILVKFYRQYRQQIDDLAYPPGSLLVNEDVQNCLFKYFFDPAKNEFLPAPRYQIKVLKHLIQEIETCCNELQEDQVSDQLMEHMGYLSTIPLQSSWDNFQQPQIHAYTPPVPLDQVGVQPVLIKEAQHLLSKGTNVGLRTWEAALHLAWHLFMAESDCVTNRKVLELGAGTGFLSLFCAGHLGASHVVATDGLPEICESLRANVALNAANNTLNGHRPPEVHHLDWTDEPEIDQFVTDAKCTSVEYDLVIGADITYHPDILRPLAQILSTLKDAFPRTAILISATVRSDTFAHFTTICRDEFDFKVVEVPCHIPAGMRYSGLFHSVATEIKIVSLVR